MNEIKTSFVSFVTEKHNVDLQKIATEYAEFIVAVELGNDKKFNKSIASISDPNVIKELKAERIQELEEARENAVALSNKSFENKKKYLLDIFEDFYPGKNLRYVSQGSLGVDNENPPFCVFIGYSFNKTAANPYAPSAIKLHFAIASGRKASAIAASKVSDIAAIKGASTREYAMEFSEVKENWNEVINLDAKDRGIRYIVTGNLLQAFSVEEFRAGKLVQFTTNDGRMRKGLYLEYYNPDGNGSNKEKFVPVMPIYKARKAISSLSHNAAVLQFDGFNGHINRENGTNNYLISLKMGKVFKASNAQIYLDQTLLPFIVDRNFRTVADNMIGAFTPENLDNVCEILQNKHNINVRLQPWQMELIKDEIQSNKFTDEVIEPAPVQEVTIEVPITANVEALKDAINDKFGNNPNIMVTSLPKNDWEQIAADKAKTKAKALAKAKIAIARAKMLMSNGVSGIEKNYKFAKQNQLGMAKFDTEEKINVNGFKSVIGYHELPLEILNLDEENGDVLGFDYDNHKFVTKLINPKKLIATQLDIYKYFDKNLSNQKVKNAIVIDFDGKQYLMDGHHKAQLAIDNNKKIYANVYTI